MRFTNAFAVGAPVDEVWAALLDVERVAPCMPGAEVLEYLGEDAYRVGIKVKMGPISMLYRGQVEIVERDDEQRRATMSTRAKEARGNGTANARVEIALDEQPEGTRATLETDVQVSGKAAAMGEGVMVDVAGKLVETFAANLAAMLAPVPVAAPATPATTGAAEAPAATGPAPAAATAPQADAPHAAPTQAPAAESSLPVGRLAAGVIAGRLSEPRTLLAATAALGAVFGAIGFAIGRAR